MIDMQNQPDFRKIPIDKVGIKGLRYPVTVRDKTCGKQSTIAKIGMFVDLPHQCKGTHMSRFVELLHKSRSELSLESMTTILQDMKTILEAESSHIDISFPYFIEKASPGTGAKGFMEYACTISGSSGADGKTDIVLTVRVPVTSLCPCSKEISSAGAHNQRGEVLVAARFNRFIWIEDIVTLVEASASCDIFSVLKREDEKIVTEKAYHNAKFVEDIIRDVAEKLMADENITWFSVGVENFESIHNHSAYAFLERFRT